jgi:Tol biopolymer transport system component
MGPAVNSSGIESRPHVSMDGRFLFFTSLRPEGQSQDIFWVDAKIIEKLKPDESK